MRETNVPFEFNFGNIRNCLGVVREDGDEFGKISKNVSFAHFNVGAGQATIAGVYIQGALYYGLSFCSPSDNFSKPYGRELAVENFVSGNQRSAMRGDFSNMSPTIVLEKALEHWLSGKRHFPKWVKGATPTLRGGYKGE